MLYGQGIYQQIFLVLLSPRPDIFFPTHYIFNPVILLPFYHTLSISPHPLNHYQSTTPHHYSLIIPPLNYSFSPSPLNLKKINSTLPSTCISQHSSSFFTLLRFHHTLLSLLYNFSYYINIHLQQLLPPPQGNYN